MAYPQTAYLRPSSERKGIDSGKKITLSLRQLSYEKELRKMFLPKDTKELINLMLKARQDGLESKYNLTFYLIEAEKRGEFWRASKHRSLNAWLADFDLPYGETLATRKHIVKLFSKETFLLAGDGILHEMVLEVADYQSDLDKRESVYQAIFDDYCRQYDAFDKGEFRRILRTYINTKYIKPGGVKVVDNTAKPPRKEATGTHRQKSVKTVEHNGETKEAVVVETVACAGCKLWKNYAESLETIIRSELGAKRLPKRPSGLS
jgi:hypothetical protein